MAGRENPDDIRDVEGRRSEKTKNDGEQNGDDEPLLGQGDTGG